MMVAMNGLILPQSADIPAGIITSSDGTGNIDDSRVINMKISKYPIVPK